MSEKETIRKELLAKRENYTPEQIDEISDTIFRKIEELECFRKAECILIYITFGAELNTIPFLQRCIGYGKKTLTPICHKDRSMTLALTEKFPEGFERTPYGILEIPAHKAEAVSEEELDLIIVPGLAFTLEGDRLGYGGGYYDRLFSKLPEKTVRLCPSFDDFIIKEVPVDEHDQKVDIIITENRSIFIGNN